MLERVAEILFDNEKETVVKEFYREVGNSDPVDVSLAVCDDTTDALIESYKKAYSWQIKRQILSVLCVSRTYQEMKILLPDVTEYRYEYINMHVQINVPVHVFCLLSKQV